MHFANRTCPGYMQNKLFCRYDTHTHTHTHICIHTNKHTYIHLEIILDIAFFCIYVTLKTFLIKPDTASLKLQTIYIFCILGKMQHLQSDFKVNF